MITTKLLGGISAGLGLALVAALVTVALLNARVDALKAEKLYLNAQLETAEAVNARSESTINSLMDINAAMAELNRQSAEAERDIVERTMALSAQLDKAQLREAQLALEQPYLRGIAAGDRRRAAKLRITQEPAPGTDDPGNSGNP
jgi:hypothetical protein